MLMQYKRIPKRFSIEMVKEETKLVNSLPKKRGSACCPVTSDVGNRGMVTFTAR